MPRNRMIKHDFWADEKVGILSSETKLLFIGMWNFADDIGVLRSNYAYLKANIFPYDDKLSVKKIKEMSTILINNGFLLYAEFNQEHYFLIKNFLKHQTINKPSAFRYINESTKHNILELFNSRSVTVLLHDQSRMKDKGKEKEKEKGRTIKIFDFESAYKKYPSNGGKKLGLEKLKSKINTQKDFDDLLIGIDLYKKELEMESWKKPKNFSTFVNQESWKEYLEENEGEIISPEARALAELRRGAKEMEGVNYFEGVLND